jgi:hypothetical protein
VRQCAHTTIGARAEPGRIGVGLAAVGASDRSINVAGSRSSVAVCVEHFGDGTDHRPLCKRRVHGYSPFVQQARYICATSCDTSQPNARLKSLGRTWHCSRARPHKARRRWRFRAKAHALESTLLQDNTASRCSKGNTFRPHLPSVVQSSEMFDGSTLRRTASAQSASRTPLRRRVCWIVDGSSAVTPGQARRV